MDANGFAPQNRVGRVEMGAATGPKQDHGYVYAVVQDAVLFNSGTVEGLDVPGVDVGGINPAATPTYLNGDLRLEGLRPALDADGSGEQLQSPTSGSTLAQLVALGFGPGIQSWYNEWIRPDPTVQTADGVPTRLVFGLEELFENRLPGGAGRPDATSRRSAPIRPTAGPCLLVLATDACTTAAVPEPGNTTTHPDQHSGIFVPDGTGGVTLVAGNDGGSYAQHVAADGDFAQSGWGKGANRGYHTLLPYGVAGAKDGVVYAGLQDNGEMRIERNGYQVEAYGGDGVFTQVDPSDSDVVYEETPGAAIQVSTDGGKSWTDIDPFVDNPSFYAPIAMDPADPKHLLSGGREVVETTAGPDTTSPGTPPLDTDWQYVFDLGQSKHGIDNQVSAIGVHGANVYAGYCGGCDPVLEKTKFFAGLATNAGRRAAAEAGDREWLAQGEGEGAAAAVHLQHHGRPPPPEDRVRDARRLNAAALRAAAGAGEHGRVGPRRSHLQVDQRRPHLPRHLGQPAAPAGPLVGDPQRPADRGHHGGGLRLGRHRRRPLRPAWPQPPPRPGLQHAARAGPSAAVARREPGPRGVSVHVSEVGAGRTAASRAAGSSVPAGG